MSNFKPGLWTNGKTVVSARAVDYPIGQTDQVEYTKELPRHDWYVLFTSVRNFLSRYPYRVTGVVLED